MGALGAVHRKEARHFGQDAVERAGLEAAAGRLDGVAVHRITAPHHVPPLAGDGADQARQMLFHLVMAKAGDEGEAAGHVAGVERVDQADEIVGLQAWAAFEAKRIADAAQELDMGRAGKAGAVPDPQHVGRRVIPVTGQAVLPGHGLLIAEQQRLVAGEEAGALQLRHGIGGQANGFHEIQRLADTVSQLGILIGPGAARGEIQVPLVDLVEIGIAAAGKGAQQVERCRRLQIAAQHALRIGRARLRREGDIVDIVAAVAGQRDAVLLLVIARTRLGELAGHAAHLHHRHLAGKGHHHGHLQQHAERVTNGVGVEFGKALGAITALQQEGIAGRDIGQPVGQIARLAGKDQRRIGAQFGFDGGERASIGILRKLAGLAGAPAVRGPVGGHDRAALRDFGAGCKVGGDWAGRASNGPRARLCSGKAPNGPCAPACPIRPAGFARVRVWQARWPRVNASAQALRSSSDAGPWCRRTAPW